MCMHSGVGAISPINLAHPSEYSSSGYFVGNFAGATESRLIIIVGFIVFAIGTKRRMEIQ